MDRLRHRDLRVVGAAHSFFIQADIRSAVPVLLQALDSDGNGEMVRAFFASGNPTLMKAGRRWAYAHGIALVSPPEIEEME